MVDFIQQSLFGGAILLGYLMIAYCIGAAVIGAYDWTRSKWEQRQLMGQKVFLVEHCCWKSGSLWTSTTYVATSKDRAVEWLRKSGKSYTGTSPSWWRVRPKLVNVYNSFTDLHEYRFLDHYDRDGYPLNGPLPEEEAA